MKNVFVLFALCFACNSLFAQATDLVVDCQTPGWLSSKINYGDQQTVKNLKVTGYINSDDLKFIGQLIQTQSLNEKLDLSEVNVVGDKMEENSFGMSSNNVTIQYLELPKSVKSFSSCLSKYTWNSNSGKYLNVDTLVFAPDNFDNVDASFFDKKQYGKAIKNIILGEKIIIIPASAFSEYTGLQSVYFRGKIKTVGENAFLATSVQTVNIDALDNAESIGYRAFSCPMQINTLHVPIGITIFHASSFNFTPDVNIYFHDKIEKIQKSEGVGSSWQMGFSTPKLNLHFTTMTPPTNEVCLTSDATIYIPKGAKANYLNVYNYKFANIIEENPVEKVTLNEHQLTMNKGENFSLSVSISPEDADDKTISWTSEDESIATVDENGVVTAIKDGNTKIYATSVATGIQDYCTVLVRKNVTSIALEESQITFSNLADTKQLVAIVSPDDATDKSVIWNSSNEQVCSVSATGLVTATGVGSAVVIATTVDGGLTATCVVKVLQHVDGLNLNKTSLSLKVGESEKLQATITPSNADNKTVVWTSSDDNVAKVDAEGNVTAVKTGQVTITATSEDNSEIKATCSVTVENTTGIVEVRDSINESYPTYDTMGRKVQELRKGQLYIRQGKKFVVQ